MKITKLVQAEILLLLITILWGSTFTIVKKALLQVSPVLLVAPFMETNLQAEHPK